MSTTVTSERLDLRSAARLGGLVGLWMSAPLLAAYGIWFYVDGGGVGQDAHAYWLTAYRDTLYFGEPNTQDAFLYSPLFAQVIWPLALLPWPGFLGLWLGLETAAFAWLLKPLGWRWGIPTFLLCVPAILPGNIHGMLAVALVLGMRVHSGWWAFPTITKVAPGAVGVVWFAARGEWRQVARVVLWGGGFALFSFALWPSAWVDWAQFLLAAPGSTEGLVRTLVALVLVGFAARRGWWWVLPLGMALATPVLAGSQVLMLLTACVRLRGGEES